MCCVSGASMCGFLQATYGTLPTNGIWVPNNCAYVVCQCVRMCVCVYGPIGHLLHPWSW
eukprot:NODE_4034_length_501_cov_92.849558_g3443_i0.p4 GENE.NODE_4034_length_501_cov_92.849558_g3443_i0~~NODE_4034_length_501_cov_92.849558_g3443_i0.p4  ORF type:complete len:59 (-),score=9.29 NODE_4034_length_501_cov_92.849558_g3443_i0:60-236(-)